MLHSGFCFEARYTEELPSSLVRSDTPVEAGRLLKALWNMKEKYTPNSVGANTHPCLTPLLIENVSDRSPSYWTQPCIPSWKDLIKDSRVGGQPAFYRTTNRDWRSTRSNAFVRSTKAKCSGCCCSQAFFCSCLTENIMSVVDRHALKSHWASG